MLVFKEIVFQASVQGVVILAWYEVDDTVTVVLISSWWWWWWSMEEVVFARPWSWVFHLFENCSFKTLPSPVLEAGQPVIFDQMRLNLLFGLLHKI